MIENAGFEVAVDGQPGSPLKWAANFVAALEETAEFSGDSNLTLFGRETFDEGWSASGPQARITNIDLVPIEMRETERFEDYETNQGFMFLTALEAAAFGSTTTETFETYDGPIDVDARLADGEAERAVFDESLRETFAGWGSTELELSGIGSAVFDISGLSLTTEPRLTERFELKRRVRVQSSISDNRLLTEAPAELEVGDAVSFVVDGDGALPEPLVAGRTYIVSTVSESWFTVAPQAGAAEVDLTADGFGAVYVLPDPGRFWFDEL